MTRIVCASPNASGSYVSHHANSIVTPVTVTAKSHAGDTILSTSVAVSASALGAVHAPCDWTAKNVDVCVVNKLMETLNIFSS